MSTPESMLEVLTRLHQEAKMTRETPRPWLSWSDYRQWQEMWNPNWSRAGELDLYGPNSPP